MKSTLHVTYIGHATFLIKMGEQCLLTDPNFSGDILFFKRQEKPGILPENLPTLDAILVSHAHYDHLDIFSYKYFKSDIPIVVPKGVGCFVGKFLTHPIIEIPTWGHHRCGEIEIHSVPARHTGYRFFPLRYRRASGYILKSPAGTIYFAGDTGYGPHFKQIASLFQIDVALLPVNYSKLPSLLRGGHLSPNLAVKAIQDLKARHVIPIFSNAFSFLFEDPKTAHTQFSGLVETKTLDSKIHFLNPGESLFAT